MGVSLVVVTYNSYPLTRRLLEPLASGIGRELEEIIVADSASPDDTGRKLKADFPAIEHLPMPENLGYGAAANAAATRARGIWLLIQNGDVQIKLSQIADLKKRAEASGADLMAPLQETPEGNPIPTVRAFPTPATILFARRSPLGKLLGHRGGYLRPLPEETRRLDGEGAVSGACFLVKKEKFLEVGGFDEKFFLFVEDIDLCKRLSAAGAQIYFTPEVRVRHFWSFSTGQDYQTTLRHQHLSLLYYFKKHFPDRRTSRAALTLLFGLQRALSRIWRFER